MADKVCDKCGDLIPLGDAKVFIDGKSSIEYQLTCEKCGATYSAWLKASDYHSEEEQGCCDPEDSKRPEEGDRCPVSGCDGVLEIPASENCSCHMGNQPCSSCTSVVLTCNKCGWEDGE